MKPIEEIILKRLDKVRSAVQQRSAAHSTSRLMFPCHGPQQAAADKVLLSDPQVLCGTRVNTAIFD